MPISVNPILPVLAVQGAAAPELVLQPGTVVDAKVLQLLADNLVRIAIANISIDVLSQVPLQAGQTLQLAVSQTEGGFRLAVLGQGGAAAAGITDTVSLAPAALADAAAKPSAPAALLKGALTPLERLAVSTAAQGAATRQGSQSQLFANLGVAASHDLPQDLQQAVQQLLGQRTSLDQNLSGGEIKNAFQKSGLFLEASLASLASGPRAANTSAPKATPPAASTPDLKAALIVLRQTLLTSLASLGASGPAAQGSREPVAEAAAAPPLVPSLSPDGDTPEILAPQPGLPAADAPLLRSNGGLRVATAAAALGMLQEALPDSTPSSPAATPRAPHGTDVTVHTSTPPPFRGAQPTAQPVAMPSITPDAPLATTAHQLLGDTDAAIARQTLLQVASLPDRADSPGARIETSAPRWNFEIPFVTPQGTAMAQFEISRDGAGEEMEAAKRVWRARFSLDVEPAGPVHALVSLTGEATSVRMWAERPATADQLRAGAAQLSHALIKAELVPGDIVIRDGTPPQSQPAPAGHFLDRAL